MTAAQYPPAEHIPTREKVLEEIKTFIVRRLRQLDGVMKSVSAVSSRMLVDMKREGLLEVLVFIEGTNSETNRMKPDGN